MTLLERTMCFSCGVGVSKWTNLWRRCGFAVNFLMLGQAPKSDELGIPTIVLGIGKRGADSCSILPSYAAKSGSTCVDCCGCVGNSLHFHTLTSKTRTCRFSSTSPPRYHFPNRCAYLRQIGDSDPSNRTVMYPR